MNLRDIEKEIKSIQRQAEQRLGFPLASESWSMVEQTIGNFPEEYEGDPEGARRYLAEYEGVTGQLVEFMEDNMPRLKGKLKAELGTKPSRSAANSGKSPKVKEIYRGPFERRLYLLDFIMRKKGGITARANWKRMAAEWNAEHPYYQKIPKTLKAEYYKIIKDDDVTQSWIAWRILPGVLAAMKRVVGLFEQHPEAKNLNELIEIEEAQNGRTHRKEGDC